MRGVIIFGLWPKHPIRLLSAFLPPHAPTRPAPNTNARFDGCFLEYKFSSMRWLQRLLSRIAVTLNLTDKTCLYAIFVRLSNNLSMDAFVGSWTGHVDFQHGFIRPK